MATRVSPRSTVTSTCFLKVKILIGRSAALPLRLRRLARLRVDGVQRPRARKVASIDEPPKLKSGAVTPVMGMIPTFIPMFTKSWNSSITAMPPAISAP